MVWEGRVYFYTDLMDGGGEGHLFKQFTQKYTY